MTGPIGWWLALGCGGTPPSTVRSTPVPAPRVFDDPAAEAHAVRIGGDPAGARARYEAILAQDPHDLAAHLALGEMGRSEGRCTEAIPHLREAARLAPASPVPWEHLAVCYGELERHQEALEALEEARRRGSDQVEILAGVLVPAAQGERPLAP